MFLRQSTASQSVAIGPFVDETDFKTAETGLTINNTDIKIVMNGVVSGHKNSGGGTHQVNGVYGITLDATDTATVGEMEVSVVVSGALPVFTKFYVLEEAVYDALFGASATGYVAGATVTVTTNNDKTGYALSTAGVDAVLDEAIEGSVTFRQMLRGFFSALLGKSSGHSSTGGSTPKYRDASDTKNRIDATTDVDGNRSSVTLDLD